MVHSSSYYQNQNYLVCILYFVQVCVCDLDKWTSPNFLSLTHVVLSQVLSSTHSSCDRAPAPRSRMCERDTDRKKYRGKRVLQLASCTGGIYVLDTFFGYCVCVFYILAQ